MATNQQQSRCRMKEQGAKAKHGHTSSVNQVNEGELATYVLRGVPAIRPC